MLSRIVSAERDRRRWAISWTNQFAWPSGLISSDVFGSGAAAHGKFYLYQNVLSGLLSQLAVPIEALSRSTVGCQRHSSDLES